MSFMDNLKRWTRSEDDYDDEDMTSAWALPERSGDRPRVRSDREVSIRTTTQLKVMIAQPRRLEDVPAVADELKQAMTIILNLENLDRETIRRILDTLSGVAYALDATISRIAANTYMIVPFNVEFEGSLMDELANSGVFSRDLDF